jgi:nucleoside-diphosphate-sugar epimerase
VLVVHRGVLEPADMPQVGHLHCERHELASHRPELDAFRADAVVDCRALTRREAELALEALPDVGRWIVISSVDVYRAFGALNSDQETDPVPIDEESPVRPNRYPYRGQMPGMDDYDKLDVEDVYLPRGATVMRLPMVYGEHDYQLREEFILRRVRAGRTRIPFGSGSWLACRVYVGDVGRAVHLALQKPVAGEVMNICEDRTYSMRMWSQAILEAAGSDAALVRVADDALPEDLKATGTMSQHIAASGKKARSLLGWTTSDPLETLRTSVRWHLENPPRDASMDFEADDRALASLSS